MEDVVEIGVQKHMGNKHDYIGCSEKEIDDLRSHFPNIKLPISYIYFLKRMGNNCPHISTDVDITFPAMLHANFDAKETLKYDMSEFVFSESDFVFADHNGFIYYFFSCDDGDDPPVYEYVEGRMPTKYVNSFTRFLLER